MGDYLKANYALAARTQAHQQWVERGQLAFVVAVVVIIIRDILDLALNGWWGCQP